MGATANEDRQAISKHVNRNDLSFMRVAPGAECLTQGRYQIIYGKTVDGQQIPYNRLRFYSFDFACKVMKLIKADWDFAALMEV